MVLGLKEVLWQSGYLPMEENLLRVVHCCHVHIEWDESTLYISHNR